MQTNITIKKIKIHTLFFASVSDFIGISQMYIDLNDGSTVQDLKNLVFKEKVWNKPLLYAINHSFASLESVLKDGDEVVFMPFVSGG